MPKTKSAKKEELVILPLNKRLLVEPEEQETKTASGLLLPENAKEAPNTATVLAVYTPKTNKTCVCGKHGCGEEAQVKVGDKVMFNKWGATPVKNNGKELFLVKEDDLLAIIRVK